MPQRHAPSFASQHTTGAKHAPAIVFASLLVTLAGVPYTATAGASKHYPLDPTYVKECGDCHVPYPPGLMPAEQWQQIMSQLSRHYGVDASVDKDSAGRLSLWLTAQAATKAKYAGEIPAGESLPRLSAGRWFLSEHRETPQAAIQAAGRLTRCDACHPRAGLGHYPEHEIRRPSAPSPR